MKYYRLEVDPALIGVELETNTIPYAVRVPMLRDKRVVGEVIRILNGSMQDDITIDEAMRKYIRNLSIDEVGVIGPCIYEMAYNEIKPTNITIDRLSCTFFFKDLLDVKYYVEEYGFQIGVVCEVEILRQDNIFEGDIRWLDNLDTQTMKAKTLYDNFYNFWQGRLTADPHIEVLFEGRYKLNPLDINTCLNGKPLGVNLIDPRNLPPHVLNEMLGR